jgi:multidrug efflux pump subunit AcrB
MGPDPAQLYATSEKALDIMRGVADVRQPNRDWGNRTPVLRFVPDQDRLNLIGLSPAEVSQQLQFLLTGIAVTQVRENIRNVSVVARSAGSERLDPTRLADFSLMSPQRAPDSPRPGGPFGNPHGRAAPETPRSHARHHNPFGYP